MSGSPPRDAFRRGKSVLLLTAGVAGHELRHKLRSGLASGAEKLGASQLRARIEQAKLMAESLGRLKGALMKAGQLLSIDASELLPPEASEILAKLQGHAEPVAFAIIRGVLLEELGEERLAQLVDLDETPAASASIGQVHRATAFGRPVAVKVQYPGIAESIDSDVGLVEKLGKSFLLLTRSEIDLAGLFEELRTILHYEADYVRERTYLDRFGALLAGDARFVVPASEPALCSRRVLTMSWEEGLSLADWAKARPPLAARVALAHALLDLYCLEFFEWGIVQTDPNFGNFLVRTDGRIVLLDFGATVEYDDAFRHDYVALLRAVEQGEAEPIARRAVELGVLDAREPPEARALFAEMIRCAAEPFDATKQPFVFGDSDYAARSREVIARFTRSLVYSPPPRRLIFLHRKLGGLFQLLKRLDVALDLHPYWARMIA